MKTTRHVRVKSGTYKQGLLAIFINVNWIAMANLSIIIANRSTAMIIRSV